MGQRQKIYSNIFCPVLQVFLESHREISSFISLARHNLSEQQSDIKRVELFLNLGYFFICFVLCMSDTHVRVWAHKCQGMHVDRGQRTIP